MVLLCNAAFWESWRLRNTQEYWSEDKHLTACRLFSVFCTFWMWLLFTKHEMKISSYYQNSQNVVSMWTEASFMLTWHCLMSNLVVFWVFDVLLWQCVSDICLEQSWLMCVLIRSSVCLWPRSASLWKTLNTIQLLNAWDTQTNAQELGHAAGLVRNNQLDSINLLYLSHAPRLRSGRFLMFLLFIKAAFFDQKYSKNCKILLEFKISVFCVNIC